MSRASLPGLVTLLLTAAFTAAAPPDPSKPPTWPQPFEMQAGERTGFILPITQPGVIAITLKWRGTPISVGLADASGMQVIPIAQRSAPEATFTYTATAADVGRGVFWKLSLATTGMRPMPVSALPGALKTIVAPLTPVAAAGQVSVTYPPVLSAAVTTAQGAIAAKGVPTGARTTIPVSAPLGKDPVILAYEKAVQDQNATLEKSLRAQFTQRAQLEAKTLAALRSTSALRPASALSVPPPGRTVVGVLPRGTLMRPIPPTPADPTLVQVTPAAGCAGDRISLRGKGLSIVAAQNEVLFTPNASTVIATNAISSSKGADGIITVQVDLPNLAGIVAPYNGMVYVRVNDTNPVAVTNPLPFRTEALPIITGFTSTETKPKAVLTAMGTNFKQDDLVHVVLGDGRDLVATRTAFTQTSMSLQMPDYTTDASSIAQVYVLAKTPTGRTVPSAKVQIKALPSLAKVSGLDRLSGKVGTLVLVSGKGFVTPTIEFVATPGQSSSIYGSTTFGAIKLEGASEAQAVIRIPYYGLIGPVKGILRLRSANMAAPFDLPFTVEVQNTIALVAAPVTAVAFPKGGKDLYASGHFWSDFVSYNEQHPDSHQSVDVTHRADFFSGYKGDDIFKMTLPLKNGWRYHHVGFAIKFVNKDSSVNGGNATLEASYIENGALTGRVHWWVDPAWTDLDYYLGFYAEGPAGVPYK